MMDNRPVEPAPALCECGDPASLHRFGNGVCLRVRNGSPCACQKYQEPRPEPTAAGGLSLVEQFTVKP